jgi:hypothetical protein
MAALAPLDRYWVLGNRIQPSSWVIFSFFALELGVAFLVSRSLTRFLFRVANRQASRGEIGNITPDQLAMLRWFCCLFILLGFGALIADISSDKSVELRYYIGAIVFVGFFSTLLYGSRKGWPPKWN